MDLDSLVITDDTGTPDISHLTTNSVEGTGVFDTMMRVVKLHLTEEYEKERITGAEYATVYLGALTSVMQNSIQYLLNQEQAKKIAADTGLSRQKTVTEIAQTSDTLPDGLGFNITQTIQGMVAKQLLVADKELEIADAKLDSEVATAALAGQKVVTELATTAENLTPAINAGYGLNVAVDGVVLVDGILTAAKREGVAKADLTEQKIATEVAATSDTKPTDLGMVTGTTAITGQAGAALSLTTNQIDKTAKETVLLAQKTITELAQTQEAIVTTTDALNTDPVVTGTVRSQRLIYDNQATGFTRDAEQKAAKMLLDVVVGTSSVDEVVRSPDNSLDNPSIKPVIDKLIAGVTP